MRIGLVKSIYYAKILDGLFAGAQEYLRSQNLELACIAEAPGAFEIPLVAKRLAQSKKLDGVICLGCVIKGETAHFEYICDAVAHGLLAVSLELEIPVTFGILTTYTMAQAEARSLATTENKGIEAARACVEAVRTLQELQ